MKVDARKRDRCNIELLETIKDYLLANPSQRFCQALYNLKVVDKVDRFYEESQKTLERVRVNLEEDEWEEDFV